MYHFAATPLSMCWNSRRRMESLVMELDEHHIWKELLWLVGSSRELSSNLGMSEWSLVDIASQPTSWCIGSLINWIKYGRLNTAMEGSMGVARRVPQMVPIYVTIGVEPETTKSWFPTLAVGLGMMMVCGEGGWESNEEWDKPEEKLYGNSRDYEVGPCLWE